MVIRDEIYHSSDRLKRTDLMRSMSIDDNYLYSFSINSKRYSLAYIHSTGHRERGYQQIIEYLATIIFIPKIFIR